MIDHLLCILALGVLIGQVAMWLIWKEKLAPTTVVVASAIVVGVCYTWHL